MRTWIRNGLEVLAVVLVVPQVFLFLYFFRYLFAGGNAPGLIRSLLRYGLAISQVSAPYLILLAVGVKALVRRRVRWPVTLGVSAAAGFIWVAAWNLLVYERAFSYVWAALPILLCSLCFAGYAAARALYLDSLQPIRVPKEVFLVPEQPAAEGVAAAPKSERQF